MKLSNIVLDLLAHPMTKGLALDDPKTTELRSAIIREKGFLRQIYESWYETLASHIPAGEGVILEVGSGGGFLKELCQEALCTEVFFMPKIDIVLDAMALPFPADSLKSIVMVDVLHHIPEPVVFFQQATNCVRSGGRCLLIEPWNTAWARAVYKNLHHEPFNPEGEWIIPSTGPLSGANGALPWILFERDKSVFKKKFPEWEIALISPIMPLSYLLSGGVSMRTFVPSSLYSLVRGIEKKIPGFDKNFGMFSFIVLNRI